MKQNNPSGRNYSYQQPRGGEVVPQSQPPIQSLFQGCITDVSPRMFPPLICEDYYYTSSCRNGDRCSSYHISEKQLLELNNKNKMNERNMMKNEGKNINYHYQQQQQLYNPQQRQQQQQQQRNRDNNNYYYRKTTTNPTNSSISTETIKPEEIIKLFKEKSITEINSFMVDNLSNFTLEIKSQIAEQFSILLSKLENNNRNNNNKPRMKLLLSYYSVLKLLIGKYGIEFIDEMKFKWIRSFLILCLNNNIEVSYIVVLYIHLLDYVKENPMKVDDEKTENENKKSVSEYIEKFGNRLCSI